MRKEDINIGRYYNTNTGRSGKFGFGCQSSTDPQDYFGMSEGSRIIYMADEDDTDKIKSKLDKIYDRAHVPQDKRIYKLEGGSTKEYDDFHNRYHDYFFEPREHGGFAGDNGTTEGEKFDEAYLWSSRLWLGLVILSDLKEDGYCELEAEL